MANLTPETLSRVTTILRKQTLPEISDLQIEEAVRASSRVGEWYIGAGATFAIGNNNRPYNHLSFFATSSGPEIELDPRNGGAGGSEDNHFRSALIDSIGVRVRDNQEALEIGLSYPKPVDKRFRLFRKPELVTREVRIGPREARIHDYPLEGGRSILHGHDYGDQAKQYGVPRELTRGPVIVMQADGRGLVVNR